jgi:transcriptional regulator with XRE-family HTH domain
MTTITPLRLARFQKGLTLDDLFLRSKGKLSPARVSRIERGLSAASAEETALLVKILGVPEQTVVDSGTPIAAETALHDDCRPCSRSGLNEDP